MNKLIDARKILTSLRVPQKQQNDICCYTLLALAGIEQGTLWQNATNKWIRIHDVLKFIRQHYSVDYAENTRETIRKGAMHHFRRAAFIEDNGAATNSPNYRYRLTREMLSLILSFGTENWDSKLKLFLDEHNSLIEIYSSKKQMRKMSVKINSNNFTFSPGKHNQLQKAILEEFAPRFAPNAMCLYVGDTSAKDLVKNESMLSKLGFSISVHNKLPDIVLYSEEKNWLYFIESVTSVGPMDPKRLKELEEMTAKTESGKIYVTAFLDFNTYKKFSNALAWETEVWIAESPDHMIHLNGDKFLGPRSN